MISNKQLAGVKSDFKMEIINNATGLALPETIIGDRTYVAATNETFSIRVTCSNLAKYKSNTSYVDIKTFVDGISVGYLKNMKNNTRVIDHRYGPKGKHALQFVEPEYIEMDESNDRVNKINVELNKTTEVGTIKVELWQTRSTGKKIKNKGSATFHSTTVHDTKKFFDKPNVASTVGESLGPISEKTNKG